MRWRSTRPWLPSTIATILGGRHDAMAAPTTRGVASSPVPSRSENITGFRVGPCWSSSSWATRSHRVCADPTAIWNTAMPRPLWPREPCDSIGNQRPALSRYATSASPCKRGLTDDFDFLRLDMIVSAAARAVSYADRDFTLPFDRCGVEVASAFPGMEHPDSRCYEIMKVSVKPYPVLPGAAPRDRPGAQASCRAGISLSRRSTGSMSAWATRESCVYERAGPGTSYKQCQMSIPYTVACALLDGGVDEISFARNASPPMTSRRSSTRSAPSGTEAPIQSVRAERLWRGQPLSPSPPSTGDVTRPRRSRRKARP